jgi:hypothetical protein
MLMPDLVTAAAFGALRLVVVGCALVCGFAALSLTRAPAIPSPPGARRADLAGALVFAAIAFILTIHAGVL